MMREKLSAVWTYVCGLDPGTMRSLCWALFGLLGMDRGETALTYASGLAMVGLGVASALMPAKTPAPGTVTVTPPLTGTVTTTTTAP